MSSPSKPATQLCIHTHLTSLVTFHTTCRYFASQVDPWMKGLVRSLMTKQVRARQQQHHHHDIPSTRFLTLPHTLTAR